MRKRGQQRDKVVLLAKNILNTTEFLISRILCNSCISHNEFVSVKYVSKEYNNMKEVININLISIKNGTKVYVKKTKTQNETNVIALNTQCL